MAPKDIKKSAYMCSFACLGCRKSFKRSVDFPHSQDDAMKKCPHCGGQAYNLGRKFRAPKISDGRGWKLVGFLVQNGFVFHSVYDPSVKPLMVKVPYPKTLEEAQEFVIKYKNQSIYVEE